MKKRVLSLCLAGLNGGIFDRMRRSRKRSRDNGSSRSREQCRSIGSRSSEAKEELVFVNYRDIRDLNPHLYAGEMYANTNVYYRHDDGSESYYRAKADGSLYCSQWYQDFNQNWYYYDENAKKARGTTKIGKITYEFDNEGVLVANGAVLMGTTYRLADQNGIWVETPGWAFVAGNWYYVLADGSLYTGILEKNWCYLLSYTEDGEKCQFGGGRWCRLSDRGKWSGNEGYRWILSKRHLKSFVLCVKWKKLGEWAG